MADEITKQKFFEEYVQKIREILDIDNEKELDKIRNIIKDRFLETDLQIHNTVMFTDKYVSPIDFWYTKDKFILNENGVLTDTTASNEAITAKLIKQYIDFRQKFKKLKKKYGAIGDSMNESKYGKLESLFKLRINGSTSIGSLITVM